MENNTSVIVMDSQHRQPWYMIISTFSMIVMAILTIAGNVFVIGSIFKFKPLRTVPNFFIVSLAVADMLVAVLVMPFHVSVNITGIWIFGEVLCKIFLTSDVFLCTASILNLCIIALDRYWAIHDPLKYAQKRTIKRVLVMIGISWTLSGVISIPPVFGWGDTGDNHLHDADSKACRLASDRGYVVYSALGSFYIPLFVMSFVYVKIYVATQRRLRERTKAAKTKMAILNKSKTDAEDRRNSNNDNGSNDSHNGNNSNGNHSDDLEDSPIHSATTGTEHHGNDETSKNNNCKSENGRVGIGKKKKDSKKALKDKARDMRSRNSIHAFFEEKQRISLSKERKAARTLAIIMITFVLCWIPFFLMYVILPFCDSCTHPGQAVEVLFVWLGYVNSMMNPVIYTVFNMEFRKAFNDIIASCCRKQSSSSRRPRMARSYV
ncbi:Octopamine receptor [Mactra antiquata]